LAEAVSTCGQRPDPADHLTQACRPAGPVPPPRPRRHLRQPLSRRSRQSPTNTALPNSGLGSARPFARWINLRACPASGSSFAIESASGSDQQPEGRTDPAVASPRHCLWRRPPQDVLLSPRPLRRRRSDACKDPFAGHRQGSSWATSSALTVPPNERRLTLDRWQKLVPFCCNRVPRAQVLVRD
jgi:hypothetical protein